jgi:predicted AAA+ superfamily ATPase
MYDRFIQKSIESNLFKGKVIVIYGARQVGKTTISKSILSLYPNQSMYLNCELDSVKQELSFVEPKRLKSFFGDKKIIVLDEAQTIENIGTILKTFVDEYKDIQIIATGSSSFGLASLSKESLTGRSFEFIVYPLSTSEIIDKDGLVDYKQNIENIFRFGMYPKIYSNRLNQEEMNLLLLFVYPYIHLQMFLILFRYYQ